MSSKSLNEVNLNNVPLSDTYPKKSCLKNKVTNVPNSDNLGKTYNSSGRIVSFTNFEGLVAPVFTCFKNNNARTLELLHIVRYASWLKRNNVSGVLVNSDWGERSTLNLAEHKLHAEHWCRAAKKEKLFCIVQIGGDCLSDELELAGHADEIGVDAVFCFPNSNPVSNSIDNTIAYLNSIAKQCRSLPFYYSYAPNRAKVNFNLQRFCEEAEILIPNFRGIYFESDNLNRGARCLSLDRTVFLGSETLWGLGFILGFEAVVIAWININPKLCNAIMLAIKRNDLHKLEYNQRCLCNEVWKCLSFVKRSAVVAAVKKRFNKEMLKCENGGFSAGPTRQTSH